MRVLYFDCGMGAAGDMLTGALLDTLESPEAFVAEFNALGLPGVTMKREKTETCGISGCHVRIFVNGEEEGAEGAQNLQPDAHQHIGYADVEKIIGSLPLSSEVRENALEVYKLIAQAEAKVHNKTVELVHFHELGAMDAIGDVLAFCMLMEKIAPDRVFASPINVGGGNVKCAHGVLPVPAPATAELLKGIPCYGSEIKTELCTPTGAALLRRFVSEFLPQPVMKISAIGYGIGTKVLPRANCVRAFLGEGDSEAEYVDEISCNVDDMTGEALGFAMERLLEGGALDVFTVPIGMKKSRPGIMLCCICKGKDTENMAKLMLRHTTSLGVRIKENRRITKDRQISSLETPYGPVRIKSFQGGSKPEYEDLARIAREQDVSLGEVTEFLKALQK